MVVGGVSLRAVCNCVCCLCRVVRAEDAAKDILRAMYLGREMVAPGVFTKLNLHIVSKLLPPSVYSASVQVSTAQWTSLLSLLL